MHISPKEREGQDDLNFIEIGTGCVAKCRAEQTFLSVNDTGRNACVTSAPCLNDCIVYRIVSCAVHAALISDIAPLF